MLTTVVARLLYAVPMAIFGLFHFMSAKDMVGMVPSFVPGGILWVYLTGIALLAAAVSIVMGKMADMACKLLAILLGIFILTIHLPAMMAGDAMAMMSLLKDMALAGGTLAIAREFEDI